MIIHVNPLSASAREPLSDILSAALSPTGESQAGDTVVAHWLRSKRYPQSENWSAAQWAHHLDDPSWAYPPAHASVPAIWHAVVHRPGDGLTSPLSPREWDEVTHRLVHAARLDQSDSGHECRWVALRPQPDRLDLLVSLVRGDGSRAQEQDVLRGLTAECQRIESELRHSGKSNPADVGEQQVPSARLTEPASSRPSQHEAARLDVVADRLLDETFERLASMRQLAEDAAYLLSDLPYAYGPEAGHRLEWIARRLHGIQQDLAATAADLSGDRERADASRRSR
ncbi:hypothetical protein AB0I84_29335 [Streptomyces spectabilis]|uniref:hypothetical protein n=1 Tax=Streptomyces spectabilis TaxID=68270 RepID=UPI00340A9423